MNDNVLIAANSYAGKSYCLERWVRANEATLAAYREEYPDAKTDILIVDNTRGSDGYSELCAEYGIRVIKMTPFLTFEPTLHLGFQIIHQEAIIEDYSYVFSVEADNIIPPGMLPALMKIMRAGNFHIVTHTYPFHLLEQRTVGRNRTTNPERFFYNELGICLMTRRVLSYGLADYSRFDNFTNALFHSVSRYALGWATATSLFKTEHIDGYEEEYTQFFATKSDDGMVDGRWNPYEEYDTDFYGQRLPDCVAEDYARLGINPLPGHDLVLPQGTYKAEANGTVIKADGRVLDASGREIAVVSGNGKKKTNENKAIGTKV